MCIVFIISLPFRPWLFEFSSNSGLIKFQDHLRRKIFSSLQRFRKDFIHAQGELLQERARCHVLVDCDYHDSEPDPRKVIVRFYRALGIENALLVLQTLE